jgi:DNA-binding LacI/PurR family transcriptional regulator
MSVKRRSSSDVARTLDELARMVGVSRATASNAFNRPSQLSTGLRQRILRAAKEVGYVGPDPTARALSRGLRGAVGLVFTEQLSYAFSDPAAVQILEGLARACEEAETGLLLVPVSAGNEGSASRAINGASVDALVLYSLPDDDPAIEAARARGIPVVTIDQPVISGVPYVGLDYRSAARLALSHLLALGHRRVGVLAYRMTPERHQGEVKPDQQRNAQYHSTRARLQGYDDALDDFGLSEDSICFFESETNQVAGGAVTAAEMLRLDDRPTAIVTDSDQLAIGVCQAVADAGLRVPDDLSVIGMDDIPIASVVTPPLTTIRQPLVDKGRIVGEIMLGKRSGKRRLALPIELVVRDSTTRPPRRARHPAGADQHHSAGSEEVR